MRLASIILNLERVIIAFVPENKIDGSPVTVRQVGAQAAGGAPRSVHRGEQDGGAADGADVAVA